jgi:hypothetical protein
MSFLTKLFSVPVGCDMPNQGGIAGKPRLPKEIEDIGCDTPGKGGIAGKPKLPKSIEDIGCDTPGKGGIAGKPEISADKLAMALAAMTLMQSPTVNTALNMATTPYIPTYVVPPMVDPGFPAGIMI